MKQLDNRKLSAALESALLSCCLLLFAACSHDDEGASHEGHDHGSHADEEARAGVDDHDDHEGQDDHEGHDDHEGDDDHEGHDDHEDADDHEGHDEDADGHDEHGGNIVHLTPVQIESAGIQTEVAVGRELTRYLHLPAVVAPDADSVTHINPKAPGIVRSIHKRLGDHVEPNDLLCVIDSVQFGNAVASYIRARALVDAAQTTLTREGKLFEQRLETAKRVLEGAVRINRRICDRERDLQQKAVSTMRPLLEAEKELENSELEMERQLTDLRAERDARLLALDVNLTERRIDMISASNALRSIGVDSALFEDLPPSSPLLAGTYEIRSPAAGIVSGRHITTGEFVDAETKLYTLEDLSQVWVLASAFEPQIQSVRTGQLGRVHLDAFPGLSFDGVVTLISYEVDPESRALSVRLELKNSMLSDWPEEYPLRPGMFGSVDLTLSRAHARVALPESALVHGANADFVFVLEAPGEYERRHVELGLPAGELVEILSGVEPGEEVAITGTFALKSALRREELGGGHSH